MVDESAIHVEDMRNGTYKVSYAVPCPGEWTMSLGIDENAYDDVHVFHPVYGFPVKHRFKSIAQPHRCSGTVAKLKGYTRLFSPEKNKVRALPIPSVHPPP